MSSKGFTHLHVHSQYSLLDGAIAFKPLFKQCRELGMDTIALTDHGNMFGAVDFYTAARSAKIKPILGIEAYIAPDSRFDRNKSGIADAAYHLLLLAENNTGYKNLLKLTSAGYLEGFYYRPRIDKEILAECSEGLICASACLKGEIPSLIARDDIAGAEAAVDSFLEIFGEKNYFIEIQYHEPDEPQIRQGLIDLANRKGIGLIATNDVHFLTEDDYEAHNCLCCISTNAKADDPQRMIYPRDVFLKSPNQMRSLFPDLPHAFDNTLAIAERCNVELDLKTRHAPVFKPQDGSSPEDFLTKLCCDNAKKIYGKITDQIKTRLDRELEVIESKGFASYFLIVWDFCKYAHDHDIPVGARGSGVGTLVGYCLGLCDVDPIQYDLLFERFMDPARNEMPDIDIDICQDSRAEVIDYVRRKYGHVAQIITFGTMKARAVIRDICRVKNVPLSEADRLAKLVPETLGMTLDAAMEQEPELKNAYDSDPQTHAVIDICKRLEGLVRHASVHAAGVVVAEEPLTNYIPLYKPAAADDIITQFEGPTVEKVGLLKMDFLGLKTLSVLQRARKLVKENHDIDIDLEKLNLKDPKVLAIFANGRTKGIFQFESGGMQDLLMKMRPDRIEDLIAANALYRPGPMTLIPDYIDRKHGAKWTLPHPIMTEVLKETYGIMVYQEQVMRICNRLGDIPLREAYTLIKAISKKKASTIAKEKKRFIAGCVDKGLTENQASEIFELIERFAGYGFNKSHSTRYAFIAYQTAYMKAYYPVEFMAALLTYEMDSTDKIVDYIGECRQMNIEVRPPDINESGIMFTPIDTGRDKKHADVIRFGLAAVKGVGEKAVEKIIAAREKVGRFKSLFHFCENVDLRAANKQVLEALIKAGAFDRLGGNRAQMMAGLEKAMQIGTAAQADRQNGQMNIFGDLVADDYGKDAQKLPQVDPWPEPQMLAFEKAVLGFYVTSNPLSHWAETINIYSTHNSSQIKTCPQDAAVIIGGMITKIRTHITRSGRNAGSKMAVLVLDDLQGSAEVVLFPNKLNAFADLLVEDTVIFVKGKVDTRREKPNIYADEVIAIDDVRDKLTGRIRVLLEAPQMTPEKIAEIKTICRHHQGTSPLYIAIRTDHGRIHATASKEFAVNPDMDFCRKIRKLVGEKNLLLAK